MSLFGGGVKRFPTFANKHQALCGDYKMSPPPYEYTQ